MRLLTAFLLLGSVAHANLMKPDDAALKAAPAAFPFDDWNALLKKFVDGKGRVDYNALKNSADDLAKLEKRMQEIVKSGQRFRRRRFDSLEQARAEVSDGRS